MKTETLYEEERGNIYFYGHTLISGSYWSSYNILLPHQISHLPEKTDLYKY